MKLAVISDIHANLEALEKCLNYLDSEVVPDSYVVLGDTVGYGADPVPCVHIVKDRADVSVFGNHDAAAVSKSEFNYFNTAARQAVLWTRAQLSIDARTYLSECPYQFEDDNFLYVHSAPQNPEAWKYISRWEDTKEEFDYFTQRICFVGHSHMPGVYEKKESIPVENGPVKLNPGKRYIINPGSVGQPRDGDHRLSFAVLDTDSMVIEIIRLEYDITTARQKIIDNKLPEYLGDRLIHGR